MRRIPGQENATTAIAVGHQKMRRPFVRHEDIAVDVTPDEFADKGLGIALSRSFRAEAGMQCPDVAVILRDQCSVG